MKKNGGLFVTISSCKTSIVFDILSRYFKKTAWTHVLLLYVVSHDMDKYDIISIYKT